MCGRLILSIAVGLLFGGSLATADAPAPATRPTTQPGRRLEFRPVVDAGDPAPAEPVDELPNPMVPNDLTIRVVRRAVIDDRDVARADLSRGPSGELMVAVELTPAGKERFAKFTADNVGHRLAVVFDGKAVSAPKINDAITGGAAIITRGGAGGFTRAEARTILDALRGRATAGGPESRPAETRPTTGPG